MAAISYDSVAVLKSFADRQRITFPLLSDPDSKVILEGSLRYQACDDHECYIPATVPLKWTFLFEPLDRERVPAELQRKPRP